MLEINIFICVLPNIATWLKYYIIEYIPYIVVFYIFDMYDKVYINNKYLLKLI